MLTPDEVARICEDLRTELTKITRHVVAIDSELRTAQHHAQRGRSVKHFGERLPVVIELCAELGKIAIGLSSMLMFSRQLWAPTRTDACTHCGASRAAIAMHGHLWLDGLGRALPYPEGGRGWPSGSSPCPEACSCIPECFSMEEHDARERGRAHGFHAPDDARGRGRFLLAALQLVRAYEGTNIDG